MFSCEFCELFKNTYFKEHLRMAGSKTLVPVFLFNKVASLMAWRPLTVLERDSRTDIFLWILYDFLIFRRTPTSNLFLRDVFFFFSFLQISVVYSLKSVYLVE